jgi:hypothetical protein
LILARTLPALHLSSTSIIAEFPVLSAALALLVLTAETVIMTVSAKNLLGNTKKGKSGATSGAPLFYNIKTITYLHALP